MAEINNLFSTLPFLARRISLITDDVDPQINAIFGKLGDLFLFVGDNGRRIRDEYCTVRVRDLSPTKSMRWRSTSTSRNATLLKRCEIKAFRHQGLRRS